MYVIEYLSNLRTGLMRAENCLLQTDTLGALQVEIDFALAHVLIPEKGTALLVRRKFDAVADSALSAKTFELFR